MPGRKILFAAIILLDVAGCAAHQPPPVPPEQVMYPPQSAPHIHAGRPLRSMSPERAVQQEQASDAGMAVVQAEIARCWNPPAGGRSEETIVIPIKLIMNPDRTIASAEIIDDNGLYGKDLLWTAVADSALRAVRNPTCRRLDLPPGRYDLWQETIVNFSPMPH